MPQIKIREIRELSTEELQARLRDLKQANGPLIYMDEVNCGEPASSDCLLTSPFWRPEPPLPAGYVALPTGGSPREESPGGASWHSLSDGPWWAPAGGDTAAVGEGRGTLRMTQK